MRRAQVIVWEGDGRLTGLLRARAESEGWWLREVHHGRAALRLLQRGGLLLLRIGRDLGSELTLLEKAVRRYPDVPVVVVGDDHNPALAGLCWDLGACFVLFAPKQHKLIPEVVAGLLASTGALRAEEP